VVSQSVGDLRLDRIVRDVVARAVRAVDPERIWLFGSCARGTNTRASDVDLAFELPEDKRVGWSAFVLEAEDEVPALVDLDLVDLGTCAPSLTAEIIRTGRLVYERPS
jgi:uncharacterized protein